MFQIPMTLELIAGLPEPKSAVPLYDRALFERGMRMFEGDELEWCELLPNAQNTLNLNINWQDRALQQRVVVHIQEARPRGSITTSCSHCLIAGRKAPSCEHQWASFVVLWTALNTNLEDISNVEIAELQKKMKEFQSTQTQNLSEDAQTSNDVDAQFDSISLFLDESPQFDGPSLGKILNVDFEKYQKFNVIKNEELLSPRLWNLPEVFRRKRPNASDHFRSDMTLQTQLAEIVRYNFSDGRQFTAREVLRHPLHKKIPGELLPMGKTSKEAAPVLFERWPLLRNFSTPFLGEETAEVEEVMQGLLSRISSALRQSQVKVFLQAPQRSNLALQISTIDYDPSQDLYWRIGLSERKEGQISSDYKIVHRKNQTVDFFGTFAVVPATGAVIVHSWKNEFSGIGVQLTAAAERASKPGISFEINGEFETRLMVRYLRTRPIPLEIQGHSVQLTAEKSQIEIRLEESGDFYLQHDARVPGDKNLIRKGWTLRSELFLQTLSNGVTLLFEADARDIASKNRTKREWDLRLLKHLGVLQYVYFETLSIAFTGALSTGQTVTQDEIFASLQENIRSILVAGSVGVFVKDIPLSDLVSKGVISCFEDFVKLTLKSLDESEAFYSESGEVILEGVVRREFRLIYEMLKQLALQTGGDAFRKSRSSLIARISNGDFLHFPGSDLKSKMNLQGVLAALHPLIPHGFKIFYRNQPIQELNEDEFRVDFNIQTQFGNDAAQTPGAFNWFELNPKFFLRGQEVDPDHFLSLGSGGVIEYEGKLYLVPQKQMPSLRRLEKFWEKLQKGKKDGVKFKTGEKIFQLPRNQTLELLALRSSGVKIRGDEEWKRLCDFYDRLGTGNRDSDVPESLKNKLKSYQSQGVQWLQDLYSLRLGALLADDMGLGKTLQTLGFLEGLREKGELGQVLVVVPSSLIFNWQSEVEKFVPNIPLAVFSNKDKDAILKRVGLKEDLVVIVTYGLLMEHEAFLNQYSWKVLVFDEAQNLKNITTKRTSAARSLVAQFKICLTGTPMENHYGEFFSIVDLLVPGSLGKLDEFRKQFVNTETVSKQEMDDLKLKIKPLLLRRTKREIQDQLPEKQETKISIAFEEKQKQIYRDIALSYNRRLQEAIVEQGEARVQLQMLTALLRLRQACSDPSALPNVTYDKVPPKLETLLESLQEIVESGESALVFTQFLQTLEHTQKILKAANIPVFSLYGSIPTKQRQKILSDFETTKGGAVLLMTLKTGGVGLNLTKASYVFHLEPWWNPSVENQATDRAHRLGQTKAVQVFRYIMHESLEEKIEILKHRKDRKFQSLLGDSETTNEVGQGTTGLSKEDFDFLLGVR